MSADLERAAVTRSLPSVRVISGMRRSSLIAVLLFVGILYMVAGVVSIGYPELTPMGLMIIIALTWLVVGLATTVLAWRLNREMHHEFGLFLSGTLSIMAGVYLLTSLRGDIFSILWVVVIYAFLIGILTALFGIKAKEWQHVYFDDIME